MSHVSVTIRQFTVLPQDDDPNITVRKHIYYNELQPPALTYIVDRIACQPHIAVL